MKAGLDIAGLKELSSEIFAPMIQSLGIETQELVENGARFLVPDNPVMMRVGNMVCGQAISSVADSVGVLTLFAHNETRRVMTTVDMTTHFMRPLFKGGLQVDTKILSNGKRMAMVSVEIRQVGSEKLAAVATCGYAYV